MNYKELQKHIDNSLKPISTAQLSADGSNAFDFFCADVIGAKKFVQNHGGYPRSEIAEINNQANLQIQASLLQQLEDFSPKSNPNAGLSDVEISLSHRSKYMQTASEQQDWLSSQLQIRDAKRAEAVRLAESKAAAAKAARDADIKDAADKLNNDNKIVDNV